MRIRSACFALVLMGSLGACGLEDGDALDADPPAGVTGAGGSGASGLAGRVAADACDPSILGDGGDKIGSVYAIVDGELAGRCYGTREYALADAWSTLAAVTSRDERRLIVALAAVKADADQLAFTTPVDDGHTRFAIAVNTNAAKGDPQELRMTIVHELAHVLTLAPGQFAPGTAPGACRGYGTDVGCFVADSHLAQWVARFWRAEDLRAQPSDGSSDQDLGDRRCAVDRSFLGAYAASSPEEDFAESFSAFVFDVPVPASIAPKLAFFERVPALVAHRDLRRSSGLPSATNTFDRCG